MGVPPYRVDINTDFLRKEVHLMKRKFLTVILSVCMVLSMLPVTSSAATPVYNDVDGHWAEEAILRWSEYGVLEGSEGLFAPDRELTRAQLATIITRLLNLKPAESAGFRDVAPEAWYADYIDRCAAAGIMQGDQGMARPDDPITREETMVMLGRALNIKPAEDGSLDGFADKDHVSDWAAGYVAALINSGIVNGVGDRLAPRNNIDRASTVTILHRAITGYANEAGQTIKTEDGIVVVAAPDVTVTGSADSVLVAQGAGEGTVTLSEAAVAEGVTVTAEKATVIVAEQSTAGEVTLAETAAGSKVVVREGASAGAVTTEAAGSAITVAGKADTVATAETATDAKVEVSKGAAVGEIAAAGENTGITVSGQVELVTVADTAANTTVEANKGSTISKVDNAAEGTTVSGSGKVENVTTSGDNTTVSTKGTKVEAAEGTTGTTAGGKNVTGGSTVTTPSGSSGGSSGSSHSHSYDSVTHKCSCGAFDPAVVAVIGTEKGYLTLQDAINDAGDDQTVTLVKDITLTELCENPQSGSLILIGKSLVLDLGGKTLTADKTPADDDDDCTAIVVMADSSINVTIKNGTVKAINGCNAIMARDNAALTLESLTVEQSGLSSASAYRHAAVTAAQGAKVTISSGTYSAAVYAVFAKAQCDLTIEGGTFTATETSARITEACTSQAREPAALRADWSTSGQTITIQGGTFTVTDQESGYALDFSGNNETASVAGGTFDGAVQSAYKQVAISGGEFKKTLYPIPGGHLGYYYISGGTFVEDVGNISQNTTIAPGYKVTQDNDQYVISSLFAGGTGTESDPYLIATAEHLDAITSMNEPYYYKQTENIVFSGKAIIDLRGTYDGGGYQISRAKSAAMNQLFQPKGDEVTVQNISLLQSTGQSLTLLYTNCATKLTVKDITIDYAAGASGQMIEVNSNNFGFIMTNAIYEPWANNSPQTIRFENITNNVDVMNVGTCTSVIVGSGPSFKYETSSLTYKNCVNNGTVIGTSQVALLFGNGSYLASVTQEGQITAEGCVNNGWIIATEKTGFAGVASNPGNKNSFVAAINDAAVNPDHYVVSSAISENTFVAYNNDGSYSLVTNDAADYDYKLVFSVNQVNWADGNVSNGLKVMVDATVISEAVEGASTVTSASCLVCTKAEAIEASVITGDETSNASGPYSPYVITKGEKTYVIFLNPGDKTTEPGASLYVYAYDKTTGILKGIKRF